MAKDKSGKVFLVGAGPGDPGLLTIKAKACIEQADVVVYDFLANPSFLDHAGENAEIIYVGKKGGSHPMKQEDINHLLVCKAREGYRVVRLKGGDPFIFGRGGEEAQELSKAGVPFEVIPGVSSAIAVPAYAGIPLTHRDYASSVAFITGHEDPTKDQSDIAWDKLSTGAGTLVFLMGVGNLPHIVRQLVDHGKSPQTPVAVIHRGTTASQKTVVGTLKDIEDRVRAASIRAPAIILVGDIVNLRRELNWYEELPLFGKRIVVTRARAQASVFLARLNALGADCIEFPTIEIAPPISWDGLDTAIRNLDRYQWLLFTSVNGVKYFLSRLETLGKDVRDLKGIKIGAIGPKTAQEFEIKGIKPDLLPSEYRAEAIVKAFQEETAKGTMILLPRAARARELLPEELTKMGFKVDVVEAYRTIRPVTGKKMVRDLLEKRKIHMVTFTSSSTVSHFLEMFEPEKTDLIEWMTHVTVACIGPITARTAREKGLTVKVIPSEYTIEALTRAIIDHFY